MFRKYFRAVTDYLPYLTIVYVVLPVFSQTVGLTQHVSLTSAGKTGTTERSYTQVNHIIAFELKNVTAGNINASVLVTVGRKLYTASLLVHSINSPGVF